MPFDGANETLKVPSNISWAEFVSKLADIMSVAPKNISVAYRFSTDTRSSPFKHLSKPIHLIELMQAAAEAQMKLAKSRSQKVFLVELKCLDGGIGGKSGPKEKGKKRKKV